MEPTDSNEINSGFQYPAGGKINYKPAIAKVEPVYHPGIGERPPELMDWQPFVQESVKDKVWRKTRQNPFIPIGLTATVGALTCGVYMFWTGQSRKSNFFMKMRVSAQFFTLSAFLIGCYIQRRKSSYPVTQPNKTE